MDCPKCGKPLERVGYEGVETDYCGKCDGFWLDSGEIGKIVRIHEETFSLNQIDRAREMVRKNPASGIPDEEAGIACPHCGKECVKSVTQGVQIDRCPDGAGIWLDSGEIELLQAAAEEVSTIFTDEQKDFYAERARKNARRQSMGLFDRVSLFFHDLFRSR
jgi:Zn-finger nucleic acid-binding protein